jgi:hypothetical protein
MSKQVLGDKFLYLYNVMHDIAIKVFIDFETCALFSNIKITTSPGALSLAARQRKR